MWSARGGSVLLDASLPPREWVSLLTTGHRANDEEWLGSTGDLARQRRVGQLVRPVLFTREESQEWPSLKRDVIANRSAQDWIPRFERVEDRALGDRTLDLERDLIAVSYTHLRAHETPEHL